MGKKQKINSFPPPDICTYCGVSLKDKKVERDHPFARGFFPENEHKNLPTVPSCSPCNRTISLDEEYVRTLLVSDYRCCQHHSADRIFDEAVVRSFQRKKGLLNKISRSFVPTDCYSKGDIFLGHKPAVAIERKRFEDVFIKMAKGIRWLETKEPLPLDYEYSVTLDLSEERINTPFASKIQEILRVRHYGNGTCDYIYVPNLEGQIEYEAFILGFYKGYYSLITAFPKTLYARSLT